MTISQAIATLLVSLRSTPGFCPREHLEAAAAALDGQIAHPDVERMPPLRSVPQPNSDLAPGDSARYDPFVEGAGNAIRAHLDIAPWAGDRSGRGPVLGWAPHSDLQRLGGSS